MRTAAELASSRREKTRTGLAVFAGLAVTTLLEYFVAVGVRSNLTFLLPLVALKAWLILWYFMHIGQLTEGGEH